jgi:hypothetical protein
MAKLEGANDVEKLKNLAAKKYKDQAVWFLNAFWDDHKDRAESFWNYVHKLAKLDLQNGVEGTEVDEMKMHIFLEHFQETLTVREMRDSLRDTGAVTDPKLKNVPLIHYLIFRYKVDWHTLVNAKQGSNQKEIDEAQRMLDAVSAAFKEAETKSNEAAAALKEAAAKESEAKAREAEAKEGEANAKKREAQAQQNAADAKSREAEAKQKEADSIEKEKEARAAQEELQAALNELKQQEDAYLKKTQELLRGSQDESIGVVTRNKFAAELAQHKAQDPLPLRKAKITQEAAVKKADKATSAATQARADAVSARSASEKARHAADASAAEASQARHAAEEQARQASAARSSAERAREASEAAKHAAEAAAADAAKKVDEAEAYLQEVKNKPGSAFGSVWWMERELHEAKAYMPEKKGGYRKQAN